MLANPKTSAALGLLLAIALGECQSTAIDGTVNWHYIGPPPATSVNSFTLTPTNPSTLSPVTFVAPTDGSNYLNYCFASLNPKYGTPGIAVNPTNRTIDVTFYLQSMACPNIAAPVSGLEGHVGPLPAGVWSITVTPRILNPPNIYWFTVELVPPSLSVQANPGTSSLELSWPVSGEVYALESTINLGSSNWDVVTNSPTLSGNTYTLSISADSGSRFFRLHHH